jgi:hypothetical protein
MLITKYMQICLNYLHKKVDIVVGPAIIVSDLND